MTTNELLAIFVPLTYDESQVEILIKSPVIQNTKESNLTSAVFITKKNVAEIHVKLTIVVNRQLWDIQKGQSKQLYRQLVVLSKYILNLIQQQQHAWIIHTFNLKAQQLTYIKHTQKTLVFGFERFIDKTTKDQISPTVGDQLVLSH